MLLAPTRETAPAGAPPTRARKAARAVGAHWPVALIAGTLLLVCVPSRNSDVSAALHVTAADVGSVTIVIAAAIRAVTGRRLPGTRIWLWFAGVALAFAAATLVSIAPVSSFSGFVRYVQLFIMIPVSVVLLLRDQWDLIVVCAAVLAIATFQGGLGTWQYLTKTGASYQGQNGRAVGTFGALDVIAMATVVSCGIILAVGLGLVLRGAARRYLLALAMALTAPLLFSLSRGSLIATVVGVAVMLLAASPRLALRTAIFGTAAAVALSGLLSGASASVGARLLSIGTVTSTPDPSVKGRYDLWHAAIGMWRDHPLFGVGLKQFPTYRDSYAPLSLPTGSDVASATLTFRREPLLSPHNMYLLVLSEQGLFGFAAFVGLLLAVAFLALRRTLRVRDGDGPPDGRVPDGRLVSLVAIGFMTRELVDFIYDDIGGPTTVLIAILLGMALWWAAEPTSRGNRKHVARHADRAGAPSTRWDRVRRSAGATDTPRSDPS